MSVSRLRVLALLACLTLPTTADAGDIRAGALVIHQPWTRATPPGAEVAGGYMTIQNTGTTSDRLIGGSLAGASGFSVHSMTQSDGVMQMRAVEGGLEIPAGGSVTLTPAKLHIMYTGLTAPLVKGRAVKGTLVFEHAGTVAVDLPVEGIGSRGPESGTASSAMPGTASSAMPEMDHQ